MGYAASGAFRPRPLYKPLIAALDEAGVHSLVGVVALPNDASEALHRSLGFTHVGTMRELGHKFGKRIDCSYWQRMNPLPH